MGIKSSCAMIVAACQDLATLPMALPRMRKMSMPKIIMPIKTGHEPRTWTLKNILPTIKRTNIPRAIKINWLRVKPRVSVEVLRGVTRNLLSTPVSR